MKLANDINIQMTLFLKTTSKEEQAGLKKTLTETTTMIERHKATIVRKTTTITNDTKIKHRQKDKRQSDGLA